VTVSSSAAVAGAFLAQRFGRGPLTDGFLAAYGVYLVLVLGAQAFRLVVVPDLTRAAAEGRLGAETRSYALAFLTLAVPATAIAVALAGPLGDAITGSLPHRAATTAASALPWLVGAAFAQLLAALGASALAARDSYGVAAVGYASGAVAGLLLFVTLADGDRIVALAWGLALNGGVSVSVPLLGLVMRGSRVRGARPGVAEVPRRLWRLLSGAAVPLALQALYIVALRLAAGLGVGRVTSLSYAYLAAATLVTATASSLSLISSAPLTRRGLDPDSAAAHVVHAAWISLAVIAAAAGVFAVVGGKIVGAILGSKYSGEVGRELGRLVVELAPWMLAAVAFTVAFPLVFVLERGRVLVPLAVAAVAAHVPISLGLRAAFGLAGLALALALTTFLVLVVLLGTVSTRLLALAAAGLARPALVQAAVAAASFGLLSLVLPPIPAAASGLALYGAILVVLRPQGLRDAWAYVRALH
jgi:hypothetical protein